MLRVIAAFAVLAAGVACVSGSAGNVPHSGPAKPECNAYEGAASITGLADSHIIVFGEAVHGTNESPDALFGLACLLAEEGVPVLVGLEAERTFGDELDAFLDHGDVAALYRATSGMWDVHDGRSSEAILQLLRNLAGLRAAGLDVSVFAFDASWRLDHEQQADWATVGRDAKMAEVVDEAARDFSGGILLLTGGFHARKQIFDYEDTPFVPMATGITARPVLSLEMRHAGGAGWIIGEIDGQPFKGALDLMSLSQEGAPARAFVLGEHEDHRDRVHWDGVYYTGAITASPPAFPAGPPP